MCPFSVRARNKTVPDTVVKKMLKGESVAEKLQCALVLAMDAFYYCYWLFKHLPKKRKEVETAASNQTDFKHFTNFSKIY